MAIGMCNSDAISPYPLPHPLSTRSPLLRANRFIEQFRVRSAKLAECGKSCSDSVPHVRALLGFLISAIYYVLIKDTLIRLSLSE